MLISEQNVTNHATLHFHTQLQARQIATRRIINTLCALITLFIHFFAFVFYCRSEKQHLKIPRDIQDAKMLAKVLDRYKDMYYFEVMFGVVVAYVLYPFSMSMIF